MTEDTYIDGMSMKKIREYADLQDKQINTLFAQMCGVDKMPEDEDRAEALFEKAMEAQGIK